MPKGPIVQPRIAWPRIEGDQRAVLGQFRQHLAEHQPVDAGALVDRAEQQQPVDESAHPFQIDMGHLLLWTLAKNRPADQILAHLDWLVRLLSKLRRFLAQDCH